MSHWFVFTSTHTIPYNLPSEVASEAVDVTSPPVSISGTVYGTANNPASLIGINAYANTGTGQFRHTWYAGISSSSSRAYYSAVRSRVGSTYNYAYYRNYCGNLIRSNTQITNATILSKGTRVSTATVFGKYLPKSARITEAIQHGGVDIPISYSYNGTSYDHMIFPAWTTGVSGFNYNTTNTTDGGKAMEFSNNKTSFAGYRESEFADSDSILTWFTSSYNNDAIANDFVGKEIDFGDTPQEVPEFFVTWLNANFTQVFNYDYTIKNQGGVTVAQITGAPQMKAAELIYNDGLATLNMTGINDLVYTASWTVIVPSGKTFLGLTIEGGGTIPIGLSTITLQGATFTELIETYRPPDRTFDVNLYANSAEPNRVDKTSFLTAVGTLSGALRDECSVINPSIVIYYDHVPDFNYVYIQIFGRYYFVRGITSVRKNLWRIDLDCDVLMTYKSGILALSAVIGRQEFDFNADLVDSELPVEKEVSVTVDEISSTAFSTEATGTNVYNYVLTVVGS